MQDKELTGEIEENDDKKRERAGEQEDKDIGKGGKEAGKPEEEGKLGGEKKNTSEGRDLLCG